MYKFSTGQPCFPLYKAIELGASMDVVAAFCSPTALEGKEGEDTPFDYALLHGAELNVLKLILEKQIEVTGMENYDTTKPLRVACNNELPLEVISMVLNTWPDAVRIDDYFGWGYTALHIVCCNKSPLEVVSLLVNAWPDALQYRSNSGYIPLNLACRHGAPLE
eukprot:7132484-Ditylum_brightwellii.AAC.1